MNRIFSGLIWTNHALQRLQERQFSQSQAALAYSTPDQIRAGKKANTQEYMKHFGEKTITLIVSNNDRGEKIVVSAWIDPPLWGTKDYQKKQRYHEYYRAGPLKKIWLIIREQLGF
ncbi:hypothetical protein A2313_01620 [Candidatus Roizmanbacteria bacterium RIFOXYB2_FULL_41_10]|uniref:DUF4258 domain-containing protein n=1 Tax=Candidatus Roizmanbacteria bacterium RIFOXYA1_FULL_41_12 TaxID=1802082 RepID=A0A1F7KGM8_9BACT|nr:MAG: hypothetical protein A2209_03060 [Candidatus Roizmanbacteria bacterium RIFOXYA1_FULL_41_12]OGK67601.1 MAG: hypothetical protein A2262_03110 [Candidatus Roizmanbacteria bacterium RIFOXYA2_FULL_41_8]OGK71067.1 MAG: hypothetical protein A2313_01620 [Candidatus Roizmanbacteria bacterium RIFOXYB2_FULL_41_10]OGK71697.1 MAG: hypothetical protein A2403_04535 [Candidatus Roizmanbacteria bacterium RIFOXYC1_FULL_41_16]OGK72954.1 MAG: hypothetical protein A2459_00340 [Candidatus Roizmanbacteria bac